MRLTWDDFLKLAAVVKNLNHSIYEYNHNSKINIKKKDQKVAAASKKYKDLFEDLKYSEFMKQVRIS